MRFSLHLTFSVLFAFGCGGQTGEGDPVDGSVVRGDSTDSAEAGSGGMSTDGGDDGTSGDEDSCVTVETYEWDELLWPGTTSPLTPRNVFAPVLGVYTATLEYPESTAVVTGIEKPSTTVRISVTPVDGALPRDVSNCTTPGLVVASDVSIVSEDGALSESFQAEFRAGPETMRNVTLVVDPFEPNGAMTLQTPSQTDDAEAGLELRFQGGELLAGFTISETLVSTDGRVLDGDTLAIMVGPSGFVRLWE